MSVSVSAQISEQPVPVGVVAGQPGDLQAHDDAGLAHADVGDEALETFPAFGAGPGPTEVLVDDHDLVDRPPESDRPLAQPVLALGGGGVLHDLAERALPHVEIGVASQVVRSHLLGGAVADHLPIPRCTPGPCREQHRRRLTADRARAGAARAGRAACKPCQPRIHAAMPLRREQRRPRARPGRHPHRQPRAPQRLVVSSQVLPVAGVARCTGINFWAAPSAPVPARSNGDGPPTPKRVLDACHQTRQSATPGRPRAPLARSATTSSVSLWARRGPGRAGNRPGRPSSSSAAAAAYQLGRENPKASAARRPAHPPPAPGAPSRT